MTSEDIELECEKRVRKVEDDELARLRLIRADAGHAQNGLKKEFTKSLKNLRQSGVKFSLKGEIDLLSVPGGLEEARRIAVSQNERTDGLVFGSL